MNDVSWINELSKEDAPFAGEKAAYLGEMLSAGLPVPSGFVILTEAYKEAFSQIQPEVDNILASIDPNNLDALNLAANKIRDLFQSIDLSSSLKQDVTSAYKKMNAIPEEYKGVNKLALDYIKAGRDRPFLILRPSPTHQSPPAQQMNFFDFNGVEEIFQKLKLCWASLFTPRAIHYRRKRGLPNPDMAVIIQERPNVIKSGDLFSVNPLNNNKNQLLIQARWGFSNKTSEEANIYFYDKISKQIENKYESNQRTFYVFDPQIMKVAKRDLPTELKDVDLLNSNEFSMLESIAGKINSLFKFPQDIEWGIAKGKFYVLQSRPITSVFKKPIISNSTDETQAYVSGIPASPGRIKGKISTRLEPGGILFAKELNSNVFNSMFGASALVTEKGDLKSLSAIIARELEIPCVIKVPAASQKLHEGQEISLDAYSGNIFSDQIAQPVVNPPTESAMPVLNPQSEEVNLNGTVQEDPDSASIVLEKLSDLEATLTELVLHDAQKRREGPHEADNNKSKLISELEWEIRSLREKVEKVLNPLNPSQL